MKKLQVQASELYEKTRNAGTRFIVHEGGARSSKTYSILLYFITDAHTRTGVEYDIVRETMPALRASAMKDFLAILKANGIYREADHNKTENTYRLHGNTFNFYSTKEDPQKVRGRKRHKILLNEANEIAYDVFEQINMRTSEQIIMDYNPSAEAHWIYDKVIPLKDCTFIHSTYHDNPFLHSSIVEAIESYRGEDGDTWKIFGQGLRGSRRGLVFTNWDTVPEFPLCSDILYGMDYGYNDPKVVVKLGRIGNDIYIEELLYESFLPREEFIPRLKQLIPEDQRTKEQYGDSEDPETIEMIYRAGFNIHPADKGKGSVLSSIESVKGYRLHITTSSVNVIKDFQNWKWKRDKDDKPLDEPIHGFSHAPAAVRYPIHTHWGKEFLQMTHEDMRTVEMEELESVSATAMY